MNMAEKVQISLDEFMQMEKDERFNYELIDEIVYMAPSPSREHQRIAHKLHGNMYTKLSNTECDSAGELDVLWNGNVLKPDLMVFCNKEAEIPEIVFEILSPSTRYKDLTIKLRKYEEMGVKEYWIVDPKTKSITVHDFVNPGAEIYTVGEIANSNIRPELELDVASIFDI